MKQDAMVKYEIFLPFLFGSICEKVCIMNTIGDLRLLIEWQ